MNTIRRILYYTLSLILMIMKRLQDCLTRAIFGKERKVLKGSFLELIDRDMDGKEVAMSNFTGSVLVVTNVASNWGLTKQNYKEFGALADELGTKGLKILAFPCNQFGAQEPGTHEDILKFVEKFNCRDKLTFFEKAHVNGKKTREVFGFLKAALPADDGSKDIRWNFAKFLIDHTGQPIKRFGPQDSPLSMKADIEELLEKLEKSS